MAGVAIFPLAMFVWACWLVVRRRWYVLAGFNALWAAVLLACSQDVGQTQYGQTLLLVLLMIVMVNAGFCLAHQPSVAEKLARTKAGRFTFDARPLNVLMAVAVAAMLCYAVMTVMQFGFDLYEIRVGNNSSGENRVFDSVFDTVLFYGYCIPMVYVCGLVLAFNFSQGIKTPISIVSLECAALLLSVFTVAGRSIFIRVVLFFVAAFLWRLYRKDAINVDMLKKAAVAGVAFFLVMELTTLIRNDWEVSFVQQAFDYVAGAIGHMQYRLDHLEGLSTHFGYIVYGGFLYYPVKVLEALGLNVLTSNEIMFFLQEYVTFPHGDGATTYNALVPNAFYYFYDSGYAGAIVFPLLLGLTAGRSSQMHEKPRFFEFVIWATCIYALAYSPMDGVLWAFRYPTAIIICFLLRERLYPPLRKMKREGRASEN